MRCPPLAEMRMVVESAGGIWLPQLPKVRRGLDVLLGFFVERTPEDV